jgi:hypothetical protein
MPIIPALGRPKQEDIKFGWASLAHVCNSSYSGGSDQEDHSQKPAWANSSRDPILKNPFTKKGSVGLTQNVGPEFKPQY